MMNRLFYGSNSKIENEVQSNFQRGEMKWNTGGTYDEKQEGVKTIIAGLNTMKIWISRETDPQRVQTLNDIYSSKIKDVESKLGYLEAAKQGTLSKPQTKNGQEAEEEDQCEIQGNNLLIQDNSKIQSEVQQTLQRGELKWNTGGTFEEKREGVGMIIEGLKIMKVWISREYDPQRVQTLNDIYNTKIKDVECKLEYLKVAKSE